MEVLISLDIFKHMSKKSITDNLQDDKICIDKKSTYNIMIATMT